MTAREVLLVVHTGRQDTRHAAEKVAGWFGDAGIGLRILEREAPDLDSAGNQEVVPVSAKAAEGTELVFVLGGDGTLLRAAELARPAGVPVLAVNMGRVGFLAEADSDVLEEAVSQVIAQRYEVVDRMTVDVTASLGDRQLAKTWALNEASVEKSSRERILDVRIEVDNRPVSSFGCDGVLCATPTGSTAYAFSAGGPVVWPDVQALLVVPSNAHAMFARPLVVSPDSRIAVEVDPSGHPAVLCCDGRRTFVLPPGARVEMAGGEIPARLVKLRQGPFTDRLVEKFELPVQGWRSPRA
jgi:NAD+ kinase